MLALLLTAVCFSAAPVVGEVASARLLAVRAIGSRRYSEALIVQASGLKLGTVVSPDDFKQAANRLMATGAFADIQYSYTPEGEAWQVQFQVSDSTNALPCRFANFVWFTDQAIKAWLHQHVPLFVETLPYNGSLPKQVIKALEQMLEERGIQGSVTMMLYTPGPGQPFQSIDFEVVGVPIPIQRVSLTGGSPVEPAQLQKAVQPLLGTNYDKTFVAPFIVENVGPLYLERGYLCVKFGEQSVILVPGAAPNTVAITIPVSVGLKYRLGAVRWTGNQQFTAEALTRVTNLKPGRPVNGPQLDAGLQMIQTRYANMGFLTARVEVKPSFDDAASSVSYEFTVREGNLYRMGTLDVAGLNPLRAEEVRKNYPLKSGQPFDPSALKKLLARLGGILPGAGRGWKIAQSTKINSVTKIVDVTLTFAFR